MKRQDAMKKEKEAYKRFVTQLGITPVRLLKYWKFNYSLDQKIERFGPLMAGMNKLKHSGMSFMFSIRNFKTPDTPLSIPSQKRMLLPLQLYEVKKSVCLNLQFLDQQQLGQALTQGYYALQGFQVSSIVVCLTDTCQCFITSRWNLEVEKR